MQLDLKEESWRNIISVIYQSDIKSSGNFWASIQSLNNQIERLKNKNEVKP